MMKVELDGHDRLTEKGRGALSTENMALVKRSHVTVKGLELENFELLRRNDLLIKDITASKAEMEKRETNLKDGEFLKNTFRAHQTSTTSRRTLVMLDSNF